MDFAAIDFETANEQRASACAVGIAVVRKGLLAEQCAWLVRPPEFRFSARNVAIHGIQPQDVEDKPEFPELWETLHAYIEGRFLAAHSAAFDVSVLRRTLAYYGIPQPEFRALCTCCLAKAMWPTLGSYTLKSVTQMLGIALQHHNAADDAAACAEIVRVACQQTSCRFIEGLVERLGIADAGAYYNESTPRAAVSYRPKRSKDYTPSSDSIDPNHPLFGCTVVFTGPLVSMDRNEAMQRLAHVGGMPGDSVTKKTHYLVVGGRYFDVFSHKTEKLQRALSLIAEGSDLEVIGEDDFLKMLDG
ncbi:MAG: hypothetical protein A2V70_01405 [Planctomycetes bacterium RBG_13_63_9]|nr:MAG: hypothetical protein A2V70_01405 [Planctomycetes bacterium RBG_13_63_9]